MKICWLSPSPLLPTGIGKVSHYLIERLKEKGFDISVLNPQYGGKPLDIDGVTHYPLFSGMDMITPCLEEIKPDVMVAYASNWFPPYNQLSSVVAQSGIPLLWYVTIEFARLSTGYLESLVGANMVATPSSFGKALLCQHLPESRVRVVPHGVDRRYYRALEPRPRFEGTEDRFVFGMVGRPTLRKEFPVLLKAFTRLPEAVRDKCRLYLHTMPFEETVGPPSWNLPMLILQLGLAGKVLMPGQKANKWWGYSEEEMGQILNTLDCHVLCTSGEGFGLPVLESMACGVPNIVSRNTALPEVAGDGALYAECWEDTLATSEGFELFTTMVDSTREQLLRMYEDEKLRLELREKALEQAGRFTWEKAVDEMSAAIIMAHGTKERLGREILKFPETVNAEGFSEYYARYIPLSSDHGKCLDVGSGRECLWRDEIKRRGYEYISLDAHPSDRVDIVADARSIPLPDKSAEMVFSNNLLEHIPTEEQVPVLREAKRVGRKGLFIFTTERHPCFWYDPAHYHLSPDVQKEGQYLEDGGNGVLMFDENSAGQSKI